MELVSGITNTYLLIIFQLFTIAFFSRDSFPDLLLILDLTIDISITPHFLPIIIIL